MVESGGIDGKVFPAGHTAGNCFWATHKTATSGHRKLLRPAEWVPTVGKLGTHLFFAQQRIDNKNNTKTRTTCYREHCAPDEKVKSRISTQSLLVVDTVPRPRY